MTQLSRLPSSQAVDGSAVESKALCTSQGFFLLVHLTVETTLKLDKDR